MSKPFVPQVIVGEAVAGESAAVRKQLESLTQYVEKSKFDIAELLYKARIKNYFVDWGFNTLPEFAKTIKIKPRTVQYMTRIVGVMDTLGIERAKYEPLGIARLREITSLDPESTWINPDTQQQTPMDEFIKGFVEAGESIEMDTLRKNVRTLKGITGDNDLVYKTLCMTRLAMEKSWEPAIELAKAKIGSVGKDEDGVSIDASDSQAAEALAVAYLIDPANEVEDYSDNEFNNLVEEEDETVIQEYA